MKQRAIDPGKIAAMCVLSAGLALCSTKVRAEDAAQQVAAIDMPRPRAATPILTVGGIRPGQVMVIGSGTSELMSVAAFAQRPVVTPAMKAAEICGVK